MLNPEAELQGVKRKYGLSIILRDIQGISLGSLDIDLRIGYIPN